MGSAVRKNSDEDSLRRDAARSALQERLWKFQGVGSHGQMGVAVAALAMAAMHFQDPAPINRPVSTHIDTVFWGKLSEEIRLFREEHPATTFWELAQIYADHLRQITERVLRMKDALP